jgi:predicted Zn-dependent protease
MDLSSALDVGLKGPMASVKTTRPRKMLSRRAIAAACTTLGLGVAIACAAWVWNWTAVDRTARQARAAVDAGRSEEARALLQRWLKAQPGAAEPYYLTARLALARGDLKEVSGALTRAQELGFSSDALGRLHAIVLSRIGRYGAAEPILVSVLAKGAPDPEVEEALARVYLETYRLNQAEAMIRRWASHAPDDARPYLWLTEIDRRTSVDAVAPQLGNYYSALERDPNLDQARLGLADSLRACQRTDEAAAEYARYLARHPDDPAGLIGAGRAALDQGNVQAASQFFDRALAHAPNDPVALRERAVIDLRRDDVNAAMERLGKAIAADPYAAEAYHTRSLALARMGRMEESHADQKIRDKIRDDQRYLVKVRNKLVVDVNNIDLRCEVAEWMFAHGRPDEGLKWLNYILGMARTNPRANQLMADYYDRSGDAGRANAYRAQAGGSSP